MCLLSILLFYCYCFIIVSFNFPHNAMKAYYLSNAVVGPAFMDLTFLWGRQTIDKDKVNKWAHVEV